MRRSKVSWKIRRCRSSALRTRYKFDYTLAQSERSTIGDCRQNRSSPTHLAEDDMSKPCYIMHLPRIPASARNTGKSNRTTDEISRSPIMHSNNRSIRLILRYHLFRSHACREAKLNKDQLESAFSIVNCVSSLSGNKFVDGKPSHEVHSMDRPPQ